MRRGRTSAQRDAGTRIAIGKFGRVSLSREFESTGRRFDPRWAFHRKIGQQIQDRRRFIVKRGVKRIQVEGRTDECRPADNDLDHKSDVRDRWGWSFLSRPPRWSAAGFGASKQAKAPLARSAPGSSRGCACVRLWVGMVVRDASEVRNAPRRVPHFTQVWCLFSDAARASSRGTD